MDSRDGRISIEYIEGGWDGTDATFEWKLFISGRRCHSQLYISDRQLRQLADLVDQVLPKPKDPTVVRVELVQVTRGRRKKRTRVISDPPAAAGDVDLEKDAIKARMLAGR